MTTRARRILVFAAVAIVILLGFLTWYRFHFAMETATAFSRYDPSSEHKLLIATQGSDFKDAVVGGVVDALEQRSTYVQVIDVADLAEMDERDWDAVVVIHTWEGWRPQPDAKAFIDRVEDRRKLIVLGTSGSGELKVEGVDAISAASRMSEVPARVEELVARIDSLIGR
jgi:hypothetical protein